MMTTKTQRLVFLAIFTALSAIGGLIKIPSPVGSVALDTASALLVASIFNGRFSFIVAFLGHIISALYLGFPLGPYHLLIAIEMGLLTWLFGYIFNIGKPVFGAATFFIGNAFAAGLPFIWIVGIGFYITLLPSLVIGTILNLTIAHFSYPPLQKYFVKKGLIVRT